MEGLTIPDSLDTRCEAFELPTADTLTRSGAAAVMPDLSLSIQPSVPHEVALLMAHDGRRRTLSVLACSPEGEAGIRPGDRFPVDGSALPLLAGDLRLAVCLDTRVCDGTLERRLAEESLHGAVSTLVTTPLGGSYLLCLGMRGSPVCDMDRLIRALHCASDYIQATECRSLFADGLGLCDAA
jgi:hypothetical protein